jgi:hypothetical protein
VNNAQVEMLGQLFGHLFFFGAIVAIGVFVGWWLGSRNEKKKFVWWPPAAALVLVALASCGQLSGGQGGGFEANAQDAAHAGELKTEIMRQALAPGASIKTDDGSLRALEASARSEASKSAGVPLEDVAVKAIAMSARDYTVLLEQSSLKNRLVSSEILTIRQGQLVGVNCFSSSPTVTPKFKGTVCGKEAEKTLGIDLSTLPGDF